MWSSVSVFFHPPYMLHQLHYVLVGLPSSLTSTSSLSFSLSFPRCSTSLCVPYPTPQLPPPEVFCLLAEEMAIIFKEHLIWYSLHLKGHTCFFFFYPISKFPWHTHRDITRWFADLFECPTLKPKIPWGRSYQWAAILATPRAVILACNTTWPPI